MNQQLASGLSRGRAVGTLVLFGVLGTPLAAQQAATLPGERTRQVMLQLTRNVPEVRFDNTRFEDTLKWFRTHGIRNIIVQWGALDRSGVIGRDTPVTLELSDVTLGDVLDLVLEQASAGATLREDTLTFHIQKGIVRIAPRYVFADRLIVRVYEVEDLLHATAVFNDAPRIGLEPAPNYGEGGLERVFGPPHRPDGGGAAVDFEIRRADGLQELIDSITTTIDPPSWDVHGGRGSIVAFRGKLIVTQSLDVHEKIGGIRTPGPRG